MRTVLKALVTSRSAHRASWRMLAIRRQVDETLEKSKESHNALFLNVATQVPGDELTREEMSAQEHPTVNTAVKTYVVMSSGV